MTRLNHTDLLASMKKRNRELKEVLAAQKAGTRKEFVAEQLSKIDADLKAAGILTKSGKLRNLNISD